MPISALVLDKWLSLSHRASARALAFLPPARSLSPFQRLRGFPELAACSSASALVLQRSFTSLFCISRRFTPARAQTRKSANEPFNYLEILVSKSGRRDFKEALVPEIEKASAELLSA